MARGRPATRRSGSGGPRQNTLSFSTQSNKVTKPGKDTSSLQKSADKKAAKLLDEADSKPETVEVTQEEDAKPTTAELAIREQAEQEKIEQTAEEEAALKISNAQIQRYWKAKESERKAPRVHQQDLSVHDKVLREFDLSSHFGPCIGIARTKRWKRAHKLGLNPPIEVLAVLMKEDAKEKPNLQRAYVDELMSSRTMDE